MQNALVPPGQLAIIKNADIEQIAGNSAIEKVISDQMGRAQFIEAATLLFKSPAYALCTVESVIGCLLKAAIFGFRLSPELGEAWAIPRKVKTGRRVKNAEGRDVDEMEIVCQFQIGYKGWQKLASSTGRVSFWDYAAVWSEDKFEYELGSGQFIKHTPTLDKMKRGQRVGFWAKAKLSDGNEVFHVVGLQDVEDYRRFSETQYDWNNGSKTFSAQAKGIWATNYEAMALRLPIKEIATKKIPRTELLAQAIEADNSVTRVTDEGEIKVQGEKEVEAFAEHEVVLHEDYLDEIQAQKTKAAVRELYNIRTAQMGMEEKKLYTAAASAHALTLAE